MTGAHRLPVGEGSAHRLVPARLGERLAVLLGARLALRQVRRLESALEGVDLERGGPLGLCDGESGPVTLEKGRRGGKTTTHELVLVPGERPLDLVLELVLEEAKHEVLGEVLAAELDRRLESGDALGAVGAVGAGPLPAGAY